MASFVTDGKGCKHLRLLQVSFTEVNALESQTHIGAYTKWGGPDKVESVKEPGLCDVEGPF